MYLSVLNDQVVILGLPLNVAFCSTMMENICEEVVKEIMLPPEPCCTLLEHNQAYHREIESQCQIHMELRSSDHICHMVRSRRWSSSSAVCVMQGAEEQS